jgi:GT2 family glycosyltransferase
MTRIAVVILNFNGEKLLPKFLPSVILHSPEAEIWVADNGSQDASLQLLKNDFREVKILALQQNYGFCGGYNRALKQIQKPYYVLLNSDIEVTSGWLKPLQDLLDSDNSISAVQPRILSYAHKNLFEYAGAGGGFIDTLGYPFCRGRIFTYVEEDHGQYNDTREVFWASGACLMVRAETYHELGGLDEDLFAHMEEIDLCWKIIRKGQQVYYCGQSAVYHLGAGTLGYESPRKTYLNFRNGLILIFKHLNPAELWLKLPMRIALDWLAAVVFLVKGSPANSLSVVKAHMHFLGHLKMHYRKRKAIQRSFPGYPKKNIYNGLIVADYYLGGKRKIEVNSPK